MTIRRTCELIRLSGGLLAHSPWSRLWPRYGVCCAVESPVIQGWGFTIRLCGEQEEKVRKLFAEDKTQTSLTILACQVSPSTLRTNSLPPLTSRALSKICSNRSVVLFGGR